MPVTQAIAFSNASNTRVVDAGARLGVPTSAWPYIDYSSRLRAGSALTYIESLFDSAVITPAQVQDLANYLALSTPTHLFDGCRYLSQAGIALSAGARNHAVHLAYYCELRAALSILSSAGIGVLKKKHYSIDAAGNVNWFNGQTHDTAWNAIKTWSVSADARSRVTRSIKVFGLSLDIWADIISLTGGTKSAIIQEWLQNWGVDLANLGADRELRNEASYRPSLESSAYQCVATPDILFLCSICHAATVELSGDFTWLDVEILSDLCRKTAVAIHGDSSPIVLQSQIFRPIYSFLVNEFHRTPAEAAGVISALRTSTAAHASGVLRIADASNASLRGVFARAFIMIRLSLALLRDQWQEMQSISPFGKLPWPRDLVEQFARQCELVPQFSPLDDDIEYDEDRRLALDDLHASLRGTDRTAHFGLWSRHSHDLLEICRFERTAIIAAMI